VLHGCRQFVSRDVRLIPLNERNPIPLVAITAFVSTLRTTAIEKIEEGWVDVKSLWPLWTGLHMCYKKKQWRMSQS